MSDTQTLADIRELMWQQRATLVSLTDAVVGLGERLGALPAPQVHVQAPSIPEIVVPASSPVDVAPAVAAAISPAIESLSLLIQGTNEAIAKVAENASRQPPTILRGGSLNRVEIIDTQGNELSDYLKGERNTRTRFAYNASGQITHIGVAAAGTADNELGWFIKEFFYNADGTEDYIDTHVNTTWTPLP